MGVVGLKGGGGGGGGGGGEGGGEGSILSIMAALWLCLYSS